MSAPVRVCLSGEYPLEEVDALVADLQPLIDAEGASPIEVDLRGLTTLHPSTAAVLAAVMSDAASRGVFGPTSVVSLPRKADVRRRLLDLPGAREVARGERPLAQEPAAAGAGCYWFMDESGGRFVGREVTTALASSCDVDELAVRAIRTCLDELLDNVIHHADAATGGFASARGWRKPRRFEVAIADLGIGVKRSLMKNPEHADVRDDADALRKALQLGVTSTPHRNSGYGLAVTRDLLARNKGLLIIKTGWAEFWLGSEEEEVRADAPFPGTLVALRARTNQPLNVTEVYRALLGELDDE